MDSYTVVITTKSSGEVVKKVFTGTNAECLDYMRTHHCTGARFYQFDLKSNETGRLVSWVL